MGIDVELAASGSVKTGEAAVRERLLPDWSKISRVIGVPQAYQSPAAAFAFSFMAFAPVTNGKVWEVLKIAASGADPFTVQASPWFAFVAQQAPQDSAVEPAFPDMIFPPFASLPNVYYVPSRRGLVLKAMERVVLCFKTLPNVYAVSGSLHAIEHDAEEYMRGLGA